MKKLKQPYLPGMEVVDQPSPFKIKEFYLRQDRGFGIAGPWKDKPCWYAVVETEDTRFNFSRHMDEEHWFSDAAFRLSNCYPFYVHGFGQRSCSKKVASPDLEIILNAKMNTWVKTHGTEPVIKYI